jgi:bacillithiol synthase
MYARTPASFEACREAASEILQKPRDWQALAGILEASGRKYGVPEATLVRLDLLVKGRAVAVVTGQQVGYLGGPLYTLLKAYHATRIAAEFEKRFGIPALPVFWLEGEDHDLEEVRDACYLNKAGELKTLRFEPEREIPGFEVGRYAIDAGGALRELSESIEYPSASGLVLLRSAYSQTTMSDAMGRLLAGTLGSRGLLVVEGMEPGLKRLALPLWEQVIAAGPHLTELLARRSEWLTSSGWSAPLSPTPEAWLFYVASPDHIRAALHYDGRLQYPDRHIEHVTTSELLARIQKNPEVFSPKAALRPLYQDFVLPSVAYVAGPGELDYHAQLTPFYEQFGVTPPSLFPRLSATVFSRSVLKQVEKTGFTFEELLSTDAHTLIREAMRQLDHGRTMHGFDEAKGAVEAVFERLKSELSALDHTLEAAAQTAAGKSLHPLQELRQKAEKALKLKHSTQVARIEKCLTALRPEGKPAERVLSTAWYLAKFGPETLLTALDALPVEAHEHYLISLSTD